MHVFELWTLITGKCNAEDRGAINNGAKKAAAAIVQHSSHVTGCRCGVKPKRLLSRSLCVSYKTVSDRVLSGRKQWKFRKFDSAAEECVTNPLPLHNDQFTIPEDAAVYV